MSKLLSASHSNAFNRSLSVLSKPPIPILLIPLTSLPLLLPQISISRPQICLQSFPNSSTPRRALSVRAFESSSETADEKKSKKDDGDSGSMSETKSADDNGSLRVSDSDYPGGEFEFKEFTGWKSSIVKLRMLVALPWERVRRGSVLSMKLRGQIQRDTRLQSYELAVQEVMLLLLISKLNLRKLYKRIGFNKEIISRGRFAELLAAEQRPFRPDEAELFQKSAENAYRQFRDKAAFSRSMTVDQMEKVAQCRVWTGKDAASHGLVDTLGGFLGLLPLQSTRLIYQKTNRLQ